MNNEIIIEARSRQYWIFVIVSGMICLAGFFIWCWFYSFCNGIISHIFSFSLAYGIFCLLFEIATLVSARNLNLPDETDICKKVSYWMTFIFTILFPAIVVFRILSHHLNISGVVLGLLISYGLFSGIWFFMLVAYGHNCTANIFIKKIAGERSESDHYTSLRSKNNSDENYY